MSSRKLVRLSLFVGAPVATPMTVSDVVRAAPDEHKLIVRQALDRKTPTDKKEAETDPTTCKRRGVGEDKSCPSRH